MSDPAPLLTPVDMAELLGKSADWWADEARARKIPHRRFGRSIRFTHEDLARIVADHAVEPVADPNASGLTGRSRARARSRRTTA